MTATTLRRSRARIVTGRWLVGLVAIALSGSTLSADEGGGIFGFLKKSDEQLAREREVEEIRKKARVVEDGTSKSDVRRMAAREIPLDKLEPAERARVMQLLRSVSMFRKLPTIAVEVDPQVYQFFVVNPDVAVSIWRAMKISEFEMTQTGPAMYDAAIGDGTEGDVEVLYRAPREHLVLCKGTYKAGPLVSTINASCLLHLRSEFVREQDGTPTVRHRLNMFVSFPSNTVEAAAKIISPVSNVIIDRNFREVSLFLYMMTTLSTQRPAAVEEIAERLDGVSEPKREALLRMSAEVHARTRRGSPVRAEPRPVSSVRPVSRVVEMNGPR